MSLPFHLPGKQQVIYGTEDDIDNVLEKTDTVASSMFELWMKCNSVDREARKLTYSEFPTKFVWHDKPRGWQRRKTGFSIGRIHAVSPAFGEAYFLRVLLNRVKGPKTFEEIHTVNDHTYPTFRDACYSLGLLDDDTEYIEGIEEASITGTASRPEHVWNSTWKLLSDEIIYRQRKLLKSPDLQLTEDQIKNLTLLEIQKILQQNNSSLTRYETMSFPDEESLSVINNCLVLDEQSYDQQTERTEFENLFTSITSEQKTIFDIITKDVQQNKGGVFFVYSHGGTGKTYLWKTLSSAIRSQGNIVLNVASSGIASLLLSGGRTAHSRFHIPINLNEDSSCVMERGSDEAELLEKTKLIIWDGAPMTHKHAFQALDKSCKDVLKSNSLFGGKVVVFGGDFRQILPVIKKGSRQQIVNASLCSSYIWHHCRVLKLTRNLRLTIGQSMADIEETKKFSKWLLDIGEGKVGGPNEGTAKIEIPDDLLIEQCDDPIIKLIQFVYPDILNISQDPTYFQQRGLLAPTDEVVHEINDRLLELFPGDPIEYLSSDLVAKSDYIDGNVDPTLYSTEILNGLKISGLPNHKLMLKVGVPVMLLRNIDQKKGLCNGTRLQVVSLGTHVIEVKILSENNTGERISIPRIAMTPSDKNIAFTFTRRQYPLSVCFAMTVNKSQGQSLSRVGLYLKNDVFSHGQLAAGGLYIWTNNFIDIEQEFDGMIFIQIAGFTVNTRLYMFPTSILANLKRMNLTATITNTQLHFLDNEENPRPIHLLGVVESNVIFYRETEIFWVHNIWANGSIEIAQAFDVVIPFEGARVTTTQNRLTFIFSLFHDASEEFDVPRLMMFMYDSANQIQSSQLLHNQNIANENNVMPFVVPVGDMVDRLAFGSLGNNEQSVYAMELTEATMQGLDLEEVDDDDDREFIYSVKGFLVVLNIERIDEIEVLMKLMLVRLDLPGLRLEYIV
ncbi:uncharacterized protein LOC143570361 [Bidens hawaiensis]|uniref:uncharacterized protein LOC143570361 n=1 Tax=Bidens hawaiensis TaxID=980011 RepID=UPI004049BAB5